MGHERLQLACDDRGILPSFGSILKYGFDVGVEDFDLGLERDVFCFPDLGKDVECSSRFSNSDSSVPPSTALTLPRYVNVLTSSRG